MDHEDDVTAGFDLISTWDLDEHGVDWITKKVISLDVDVMDPSMVPASMSFQPSPRSSISYLVLRTLEFGPSWPVAGTPEAGGWTTREVRRVLYGLKGLNIVGFDIVELAPAYDTNGMSPFALPWKVADEQPRSLLLLLPMSYTII
jgi:agmatinase